MGKSSTPLKYILLYLPWLFSLFLSSDPAASYMVAWLGSFYILYISLTNKIKDTSAGQPLAEKILKPLFLMQIIFAGYTFCTSIFYFANQMGYVYLARDPNRMAPLADLEYTASCQRDYVLGHAALAHGLLIFYRSEIKEKYLPVVTNWPAFLIRIALICIPLALLFPHLPGLSQFGVAAQGLAFVSITLAFAISIPQRNIPVIILAGALYAYELARTLHSGFKQPVIVSIMILGIFLYPFYKRLVLILFVPLLLFLFFVLPTYVAAFRQQNWSGTQNTEVAQAKALERVKKDLSSENIKRTNWLFLTVRLSEVQMFVKYKKGVEKRGFYGLSIVKQSLLAVIPRFLWPGKPITENLAMKRAIENNIVDPISRVSAKPAFFVDSYLSGGLFGIWLALFLYGAIAQLISNKAEKLFGGYLVGTALVFTALFQPMWRGECYEFMFNDIFWSFVGLHMVFYLFRKAGVLRKVKEEEPERIPRPLQVGLDMT
jgi:hypothetical protein